MVVCSCWGCREGRGEHSGRITAQQNKRKDRKGKLQAVGVRGGINKAIHQLLPSHRIGLSLICNTSVPILCSPVPALLLSMLLGSPDSLSSQRERGTGDGGGQVKAFGDLPPDLLVDDFHQPSFLGHQFVEHVEVQDLLCHDGDPIDGSSCRETAGKKTWRERENEAEKAGGLRLSIFLLIGKSGNSICSLT